MPRNMSFALTTKQIMDRSKTVTRRLGWDFLKAGDILNACEKCQGLKKGEKIKRLCQIRVVRTEQVLLCDMLPLDCEKEGFPQLDKEAFISMFIKEMECHRASFVNRIEFEYI